MSTTFNFEELDGATHDYLVAVRDNEGLGAPGVFVTTKDSLPGCGCIAGPIVIAITLMFTLTTWLDLIYDDPVRVALLQTGGLLLGGWLLIAGFRGSKGTNKNAGNWVYVDPLFLYEAYREKVTITPVEDVVEAHFTHNYNNGNYQNSVVRISMGGNDVTTVTLANENRAEQMVVFLNYVAWARGPDGGERADLPAATLGGLAKYVAKNDHEPLDAENNINLNLVELDITEVPEEPAREGRAVPGFIPYIFLIVGGAVLFFFMAYVVNPPLRDDAIFEAVTRSTSPPSLEPRFLRAYLVDQRNTMHRDEVTKKLSDFYTEPVKHVKNFGTDPQLREGMAKILDSVRTAEAPVVSLRVKEEDTPADKTSSRATRENELRTGFVNKLNEEMAKPTWGQPIKPPPDTVFKEQPPPIGQQLLAFIEAPEDAKNAHFTFTYKIEQADQGQYRLSVRVEIRTNVEENPVATSTFILLNAPNAKLDDQIKALQADLVIRMVGPTGGPGVPGMPPGKGGFQPGGFGP
jgi:hypothetical protein